MTSLLGGGAAAMAPEGYFANFDFAVKPLTQIT
jgi:hypothetical protein